MARVLENGQNHQTIPNNIPHQSPTFFVSPKWPKHTLKCLKNERTLFKTLIGLPKGYNSKKRVFV
jgi:hypothetical protein